MFRLLSGESGATLEESQSRLRRRNSDADAPERARRVHESAQGICRRHRRDMLSWAVRRHSLSLLTNYLPTLVLHGGYLALVLI